MIPTYPHDWIQIANLRQIYTTALDYIARSSEAMLFGCGVCVGENSMKLNARGVCEAVYKDEGADSGVIGLVFGDGR